MRHEIPYGEVLQILADHKVSIRQKGDWQLWWHRFVQLYFFIIGLFKPGLKKSFYEDYVTAIGRTIYLTDIKSYNDTPYSYQAVILHELDHIREYEARGVMFFIRYLLFPKWRAYFEYKAYCHQLIHFNNLYQHISTSVVTSITSHFKKGSIYMLDEPDGGFIVSRLAAFVEAGDIDGKTLTGFESKWKELMELINDDRGDFPRKS